MATDADEMTLGEVGRRVRDIEGDVKAMREDVGAIKTTLAAQSVRVGVMWAGVGLGSAALVTSTVGALLAR